MAKTTTKTIAKKPKPQQQKSRPTLTAQRAGVKTPWLKGRRVDAGAWRLMFLAAYSNSGNVRASCLAADVSRETLYYHLREDSDFAEAVNNSKMEAVDLLRAEAWNRAIGGNDRMLEFYLSTYDPDAVAAKRAAMPNVNVGVAIAMPNGADPVQELKDRLTTISERMIDESA